MTAHIFSHEPAHTTHHYAGVHSRNGQIMIIISGSAPRVSSDITVQKVDRKCHVSKLLMNEAGICSIGINIKKKK